MIKASEYCDHERDVADVGRKLRQARVLIEHAYTWSSFESFAALCEFSRRTYLALVYELLLDAETQVDRLREYTVDEEYLADSKAKLAAMQPAKGGA